MSLEVSYSEARSNLASLLDQVTDNLEVVVIKRRGHEPVAMVSAAELSSMMETAHVFRSAKNASRLAEALEEVRSGRGEKVTVDELRREFGVKPKNER